jgi:hypothetical protein
MRWRNVPKFDRATAVAYDLPLGQGTRATVYVIRCRAPRLPVAPPITPDFVTGRVAIAAWQVGDLVYVAVVEGGAPAYQALLQRMPLT